MVEPNAHKPDLNVDYTVEHVGKEIKKGLDALNTTDKPFVTFFGSHTLAEDNMYYMFAQKLAEELGKKGFAIISGGGPGIMQAANVGAMNVGAPSFGFKAELLTWEKVEKPFYSVREDFRYFFVRRFLLSTKSKALLFFPGGYGTLDELFEALMLTETQTIDKVPMICIGKNFWEGMFDWLKHAMIAEGLLPHGAKDLELLHFADTTEEVLALIEKHC